MSTSARRPSPAIDSLDGAGLLKAFAGGVAWLGENRGIVDSLNVFPVPDGDTGTNMYLTLTSALKEAQKNPAAQIGVVADAIALGSLMGARGNSGVIFSQLMRGLAKHLHGKAKATPADLAGALVEASNMAYKAVMKPVEGTILTVARMAGRAAMQRAREGGDIHAVLGAAIRQAEVTLERTPEMLHTLKEAGVVDAGGKGYVFFLIGAASALSGAPLETVVEAPKPAPAPERERTREPEFIEFAYCTEFIIKGSRLDMDAIRRSITSLGDSLLVVGGPEAVKVHVHSNHPGSVLETCLSHGTLHEIHVNNMVDQHEEYVGPETRPPESKPAPVKDVGIVAVAAGEGVSTILKSLGADVIVTGGQTMNPSIQEIVAAVEATKAKEVIVLPNNSNVVLTARQAAEIGEAKVHVVPTRTVQQGIAALISLSPGSSAAESVDRMAKAASSVKSGEITYAVRDSRFNGIQIAENDIIGILDGELVSAGKSRNEVTMDLISKMLSEDGSLVTLIYGADVTEAEASSILARMRANYPEVEFELQYGGQPLYFYLLSVE